MDKRIGSHNLTTKLRASDLTQPAIAILSLTGVLFVLAITARYGVGMSPDSAGYLGAANSILAGDGFTIPGGELYIKWPPLFPIVLAVPGALGIDGVTGARFINAFAFGGIVFGAGQLFRVHLNSKLLVIAGTVSILLSPVLLRISIKVWTEPLFTLFAVVFVYFLYRFLNEKRMAFLIFISILASLAFLQRYIGITLVLAGGFAIAFAMRNISMAQRLKYLTAFGLISVAPIGIWVTRNYVLTSTATGGRPNSFHTILQSLGRTVETLTSWFIPNQIPFSAAVIILCVGVSILICIVVGVQYKLNRRVNVQLEKAWPAIGFLLVYLIVLIPVSTRVFDRIEFRLLAPVYVFIMLLLFIGVEAAARSLNRIGRSNLLGNCLVTVIAALWLTSLVGQFASLELREQAQFPYLELREQAQTVVAAFQWAGQSLLRSIG